MSENLENIAQEKYARNTGQAGELIAGDPSHTKVNEILRKLSGQENDLRKLKEDIQTQADNLRKHAGRIDRNDSLVFFGFIILLVMVAGMIIDAWRFKGATHLDLIHEVNSQEADTKNFNDKLDILIKALPVNEQQRNQQKPVFLSP